MEFMLTRNSDNDEEFLLDAPNTLPIDANEVVPIEQGSDDMAIDEEGRPRFAPAKDIVRFFSFTFKGRSRTNKHIGPSDKSRHSKNPYSSPPNDTS